MIGVISRKEEEWAVREFFELFKTPWEFYSKDHSYDAVISTIDFSDDSDTKVLILFSSGETEFDRRHDIGGFRKRVQFVEGPGGESFPVYGEVRVFYTDSPVVLYVKGTGETIGAVSSRGAGVVVRVGVDLFREVEWLLTKGQPPEYGDFPTIDIQIALLRRWILSFGITLVEIPPVPAGYTFVACLTHDVDCFGVRKHFLDHTLGGFVYRACVTSTIKCFSGRGSARKMVKNWLATLSLPAVFLRLAGDFWGNFDSYLEMEKGTPSTYFLVPFPGRPGKDAKGEVDKKRAVRYDVSEMKTEIQKLINGGCEIGVHGIDAWHDPQAGGEEYDRIAKITGESCLGIRMHWLYFDGRSFEFLEHAGFSYDSTLGFNGEIGYRSGTTQAFQPKSVKNLLEIPLNIQDTALFYPRRMNLEESEAHERVTRILRMAASYGGVVTVNWHDRSLAPERLWGDFYETLLQNLKSHTPWFATVGDASRWFRTRRGAEFDEVQIGNEEIYIRLRYSEPMMNPGMMVRIHKPGSPNAKISVRTTDIPLKGDQEIRFKLEIPNA